jgi:hypothetical protein
MGVVWCGDCVRSGRDEGVQGWVGSHRGIVLERRELGRMDMVVVLYLRLAMLSHWSRFRGSSGMGRV